MDFNNNYHKITKLVCKGDEETQKLCTASMILLTFVANLDRKVTVGEMKFLKYFLHKNFDVPKTHLNHAIHDYLYIHSEDQADATKLSEVRSFLKEHLFDSQKDDYLRALLKISSADGDMDQTEKRYIQNIALGLGVDKLEITQEIISEELSLLQKIDAEIAADAELDHNEQLQFASVHEMLEDLGQRTK
jgi:uncharacterized tellurite resistance protein B-like protein